MNKYSRFSDSFVEDTLHVEERALAKLMAQHLSTLDDRSAKKRQKEIARQSILHDIGNMVVVAFAGLEHAIRKERWDDYCNVIRAFSAVRPALKKHRFCIPPQIDHAIELVKNPQLDY